MEHMSYVLVVMELLLGWVEMGKYTNKYKFKLVDENIYVWVYNND